MLVEIALSVAVLAIFLTAPIGALSIDIFNKKFLSKSRAIST